MLHKRTHAGLVGHAGVQLRLELLAPIGWRLGDGSAHGHAQDVNVLGCHDLVEGVLDLAHDLVAEAFNEEAWHLQNQVEQVDAAVATVQRKPRVYVLALPDAGVE